MIWHREPLTGLIELFCVTLAGVGVLFIEYVIAVVVPFTKSRASVEFEGSSLGVKTKSHSA